MRVEPAAGVDQMRAPVDRVVVEGLHQRTWVTVDVGALDDQPQRLTGPEAGGIERRHPVGPGQVPEAVVLGGRVRHQDVRVDPLDLVPDTNLLSGTGLRFTWKDVMVIGVTVPVMIATISVNPDASFTLIAVGIVLSIIAPIILAIIFRRFITSGLVSSLGRA